MFSKIVFLSFVLRLASGTIFRDDAEVIYCYNTTEPKLQHKQFTTKTTYEFSRSLEESKITGCEPVKIWLLSRHGTIYPLDSTIDIEDLKSLHDSISALTPPLCDEDKGLIQAWKLNENINQNSGHLSPEGLTQMKTLARDYKNDFEGLLNVSEKVLFRHTNELRNKESFDGFAAALYGDENDVEADFTYDDMLFKFYEKCVQWNEKNDKLNESTSNLSKFEKSVFFTDTIKEISDRLGLSETLSLEKVKNIWDMCRIDSALLRVEDSSPWCSAFTEAHVDVLEYRDDIELFYKTGHGEVINSHLACQTVVDLIDHFENSSTDSPKAIVSFADATTVQLFLTALGTHKDKDIAQPSTENMAHMDDRKWKSSQMSPFASNVAVVKYECPNAEVNAKVKFFLNQKLLKLDWCTEGVCEFGAFLEKYRSYKQASCADYFCTSIAAGKARIALSVGVIAAAVSLILIYLH